ncbi:SDR family NAD(P)-dependent oxidoreductase [Pseudonocardia acaciae]|uniref:SDR family NAD(P)-dependent oxidoreductase n=1 Tax=Pseudonocardia acaciae TaxID=551276 RepID=UPI00048B0E8A|nr:SDR family NAD(P)-dependent oxidoreductase [Pseudonocardia acaciae]
MTDTQVALVTGANKGLGRETARQLAGRGMEVLAGSRDAGRGERMAHELAEDGVIVTPVPLDVTDPATVAAVASRIRREYGRLDVLVNNAGAALEAPATEVTAEGMRQVYEVNVFGVVTAIGTLLPLLRASAAPRIVNVSSTTASLSLTGQGTDFGGDADRRMIYTSSKSALNMLTLQYARAFAGDPALAHVRINSVTPGYTATDMTAHRGTRTVTEGAAVIVDLATQVDGPTGGFFNERGMLPW